MRPCFVPVTVLPEAAYLLRTRLGHAVEVSFARPAHVEAFELLP